MSVEPADRETPAEVWTAGRRVHAVARLVGPPDEPASALRVSVRVATGWHSYLPGATDGLPLTLTCVEPSLGTLEVSATDHDDRHVGGEFTVEAKLPRSIGTDPVAIELRLQTCDGRVCEAPEKLVLTAARSDAG